MQGIDKRDFYRLPDNIQVDYSVIKHEELDRTDAADHFELSPAFLMLKELYQLDLEGNEVLRAVSESNRELGNFLGNMNRRIDVMKRTLIAGEMQSDDHQGLARISEGGISFVTTKLVRTSTIIAMKLLIKPELLGFTCFGEVRHCRLREDSDGYVIGVRFIDLDAVSQKLVARHIIRRQSQERRDRLRRERLGN